MFDKEVALCDCLLCQLVYNEKKDTLLHLLGQLLYLAGVARHLLRHHKQQVGVVYPLGMNQPAESDNSVNNPPLLTYITGSFANGSVRFMRESYKAHLTNDVTVSLKLIRFNHEQSLLALTERWICLANCAPVTVSLRCVCVTWAYSWAFTCVHTWNSCHSLAGCCRSCWGYLSRTGSGSLHNYAL